MLKQLICKLAITTESAKSHSKMQQHQNNQQENWHNQNNAAKCNFRYHI